MMIIFPDQSERLTAALNVLGFTDIDSLENYVLLHGACRIVATREPVEETQSQFPPSTQRRATKYQARKEELADSKLTAQVLQREYNREKLELERALQREEHEVYNVQVEIKRRLAAVEMLEKLQTDFTELDDFAVQTKLDLNAAYEELDAYDLAKAEGEAKVLELNAGVLERERELAQIRKRSVEQDLEIAQLQQRLTQITPSMTSNLNMTTSSTLVES